MNWLVHGKEVLCALMKYIGYVLHVLIFIAGGVVVSARAPDAL